MTTETASLSSSALFARPVRVSRPENTILCLACASSLPPRTDPSSIFRTLCCGRPICPSCLDHSPRLARYDPCLACLSGVRAVSSSGKLLDDGRKTNVNAEMRDEDVFALGDDDDLLEEEDESASAEPPPAYQPITPPAPALITPDGSSPHPALNPQSGSASSRPPSPTSAGSTPSTYHLKPSDTLHGLALRFGVPARTLCTLNKLPFSTLSTTPHLLHTRTTIELPSSARGREAGGAPESPGRETNREQDEERRKRRAREQAEKRLQVLTKEVDWRVAKAYVALAEEEAGSSSAGNDASYARALKAKEAGAPIPSSHDGVEGCAIDSYLEDEEWEQRMRAEGAVPGRAGIYPGSSSGQGGKGKTGTGKFW